MPEKDKLVGIRTLSHEKLTDVVTRVESGELAASPGISAPMAPAIERTSSNEDSPITSWRP